MALRDVKNKIRSVKKTGKVTKAMEAVSAVKMRKSQERALDGRPYALAALTILRNVAGSLEGLRHSLAEERDVKNVCVVVVTSDKGLAGALNSSVLKEANSLISKLGLGKEHTHVIAFGKKAFEFFSKREYPMAGEYINIHDELDTSDVFGITTKLIGMFTEGQIDAAYLVYPEFLSTFEQEAVTRAVLPLSYPSLSASVEGIIPEKGKFADTRETEKARVATYTIEPSPEEVLEELITRIVNVQVYHAVLEAKASEHSARMVAMKNASDKARDLAQELNLAYNKERQALITREVSEIIGGIETMQHA